MSGENVRRFDPGPIFAAGVTAIALAAVSAVYAEKHTQDNEPERVPNNPAMSLLLDEVILKEDQPQIITVEAPPPPAPEPIYELPTVYWIFAHPDDETLAAAGALMQSEDEGNRNIVVIISSGENTVVGPRIGLNKAQTARAREGESRAALSYIELEDIRYFGIPEGQISKDFVKDLIRGLKQETQGKAIYRGHSPYDSYSGLRCGHPDHCVIGTALVESRQEGEIEDLRLYRISHLMGGSSGQKCDYLTPAQSLKKQTMRREYAWINRGAGRYGIAGQSVPGAWYQTSRQPECYDLPR